MSDHEDTPSRPVSRVIHADPADVYAFAADVDNLPRWAAGLARTAVTRDGEDLLVESPWGPSACASCPATIWACSITT